MKQRGFKCRTDVLECLLKKFDELVAVLYDKRYIQAVENFDNLVESFLRSETKHFYDDSRSADQAWRTCKGTIYEYVVFRTIEDIIQSSSVLRETLAIYEGDKAPRCYSEEVVIKNWNEIYPDVDLLIVNKKIQCVEAIISCKTSLRERLTETAFWKREIELKRHRTPKLIFVTTDKDGELKSETNRYILLHVVDCTFISNPENYRRLIKAYKRKYGDRKDFGILLSKVRLLRDIGDYLQHELLT